MRAALDPRFLPRRWRLPDERSSQATPAHCRRSSGLPPTPAQCRAFPAGPIRTAMRPSLKAPVTVAALSALPYVQVACTSSSRSGGPDHPRSGRRGRATHRQVADEARDRTPGRGDASGDAGSDPVGADRGRRSMRRPTRPKEAAAKGLSDLERLARGPPARPAGSMKVTRGAARFGRTTCGTPKPVSTLLALAARGGRAGRSRRPSRAPLNGSMRRSGRARLPASVAGCSMRPCRPSSVSYRRRHRRLRHGPPGRGR